MSLSTLIADTRKAVADDAANAQAVFSAQGTLVGITEVDVQTGAHTFKVDEPPALGGADVAANPVQFALASLGSCQAITYRFWAEHLGISFDSLTVRLEGDLDNPVRSSLAGPHARFAERRGNVRRYPAAVSPFVALPGVLRRSRAHGPAVRPVSAASDDSV